MKIDREELIDELTVFDKLVIYNHYVVTQLGLKYNFHVDITKDNVEKLYLWENLNITSFEDFISKSNIKITDLGDGWEINKNAQRIRVDYYGIYDWYMKFKNVIQL